MKHLLVMLMAVALALWPATALAACTTTTIILDGQVRVCTSCCFGGNCTVSCL